MKNALLIFFCAIIRRFKGGFYLKVILPYLDNSVANYTGFTLGEWAWF